MASVLSVESLPFKVSFDCLIILDYLLVCVCVCVCNGRLADEWATLRVICRTVDLESIQCVDPFSKSGFLECPSWQVYV